MNKNIPHLSESLNGQSKRLRTRAVLIEASVELFATLGYAETTLEAVAQKANLHVQTLYRYFPNKELLAVAPEQDNLDSFKVALGEKHPNQTFTSFWREWAEKSANHTQTHYREMHLQRSRSLQTPSVLSQAHMLANEYLNLMETGIADELRLDPKTSDYPRLFAAMLWEGTYRAHNKWVGDQGRSDVVELVTKIIDDVCRLMQLWKSAKLLASGKETHTSRVTVV